MARPAPPPALDDDALDALLDRALTRVIRPSASAATARELARAAMTDAPVGRASRRSGPPRRRVLAAGVVAALAVGTLAAGIATKDVWMTMPPFVGASDGVHRTPGIRFQPAAGALDAGEHCLYYVDVIGLSVAQADALDDAVTAADLSGLDDPVAGDADDYDEVVQQRTVEAFQDFVPGLSYHDRDALPTIDATIVSCAERYW